MKQLRWAFLQFRLWALELGLWMDGLSWKEAHFLAEKRSNDLSSATPLSTSANAPES